FSDSRHNILVHLGENRRPAERRYYRGVKEVLFITFDVAYNHGFERARKRGVQILRLALAADINAWQNGIQLSQIQEFVPAASFHFERNYARRWIPKRKTHCVVSLGCSYIHKQCRLAGASLFD